MHSDSKQWWK